jgi:hypothetical protein
MQTSEEFVADLTAELNAALGRIGAASAAGTPAPALSVVALLKVALKNELEAAEEAALWMTHERDVAVKLALARQCGDEARHYRVIEQRLNELEVDLADFDPTAGGPSAMFRYLAGLGTTVERVAAGQFTREGLARVRNHVFIEFCESRGDRETARLYREVIEPDEAHHHEMGRRLLARLATTAEAQEAARAASRRTLELAEELQEAARMARGISRAPGC